MKKRIVVVLIAGISISSAAFASEEVLSFKAKTVGELVMSETPSLAVSCAFNPKSPDEGKMSQIEKREAARKAASAE